MKFIQNNNLKNFIKMFVVASNRLTLNNVMTKFNGVNYVDWFEKI